jgi:NAD(P)-dependent dehydrogenase (short-subunit alcohol dehydrogenase family)
MRSDLHRPRRWWRKPFSTFGRLDAAFENAGIQSPAVETADETGDVFDRIDRINLRGVWSCMKYERLQMHTQKERHGEL